MKTKEEICTAFAQVMVDCLDYLNQQGCAQGESAPATRLYSYDDLADMLGKSKNTVRQWVCAGEFGEPVKVGSSTRVTQAGVDKFLSDHSGPTKKKRSGAHTRALRTTTVDLSSLKI